MNSIIIMTGLICIVLISTIVIFGIMISNLQNELKNLKREIYGKE